MRCSSGPKKGFNIRWKLNYCWHLTRVAVVLSSTLWPTGPPEFHVFGIFVQCIHHSMLNKTTQNMRQMKSPWGVVPSSFMKAILCSTVSGEEAGTGRKRFTPVPTNPSAITCRRFFNKKSSGKSDKQCSKTWAKISAKFRTYLSAVYF